MWLLIVGIILLVAAAILQSYCAIGLMASPVFAPAIIRSRMSRYLILGWILLFIVGITMLFFENWIVGIIAIPIYWLVLPLLISPSMRRYYLGSWDENKNILEKYGYNKSNYLRGDWWKRQKEYVKDMNAPNHPSICDTYEEVEEVANSSWETLKKAVKKSDEHTLDLAIKNYSQSMNSVKNIWPRVVEELEIEITSATKTGFLGGYAQAKRLLPEADEQVWIDRGDHVASRTLYKVSRVFPFKK